MQNSWLLIDIFKCHNKGWNAGSAAFSDMVTNDTSRGQFVSQAVQFLISNNFDGLDLDWEYPGQWLNFFILLTYISNHDL